MTIPPPSISPTCAIAETIGREAGERAVKRLNPRKVKSQSVPVIYDRRVASGLIGHLLGAINGAAIARGTSFLKDQLGQQIFGSHITIVEDPFIRRGLGSRPFDGEGLACHKPQPHRRGRADRLDSRPALGPAAGPCAHRPGLARRALAPPTSICRPARRSPEEQIKGISQGLYVTELIGSSINMVTGDYSRGASGFWIENGELTYPVSEITIAGNLKDMFKTIVARQQSRIPLRRSTRPTAWSRG